LPLQKRTVDVARIVELILHGRYLLERALVLKLPPKVAAAQAAMRHYATRGVINVEACLVICLKINNLVAGKGNIASLTLCYSLCKSEDVNIVSATKN
jgi:hypothetical protein